MESGMERIEIIRPFIQHARRGPSRRPARHTAQRPRRGPARPPLRRVAVPTPAAATPANPCMEPTGELDIGSERPGRVRPGGPRGFATASARVVHRGGRSLRAQGEGKGRMPFCCPACYLGCPE